MEQGLESNLFSYLKYFKILNVYMIKFFLIELKWSFLVTRVYVPRGRLSRRKGLHKDVKREDQVLLIKLSSFHDIEIRIREM